jgi:hypothetical protein
VSGELATHAHQNPTSNPFALTAAAPAGGGSGYFGVNNYAYNTANMGSSSPLSIMSPRVSLNVMVCL